MRAISLMPQRESGRSGATISACDRDKEGDVLRAANAVLSWHSPYQWYVRVSISAVVFESLISELATQLRIVCVIALSLAIYSGSGTSEGNLANKCSSSKVFSRMGLCWM